MIRLTYNGLPFGKAVSVNMRPIIFWSNIHRLSDFFHFIKIIPHFFFLFYYLLKAYEVSHFSTFALTLLGTLTKY